MKSDKFLKDLKTNLPIEKKAFFTIKKGGKIEFSENHKLDTAFSTNSKPKLNLTHKTVKTNNQEDIEKEQILDIKKIKHETPMSSFNQSEDTTPKHPKDTTISKNDLILVEKDEIEKHQYTQTSISKNLNLEKKQSEVKEKKEAQRPNSIKDFNRISGKTKFSDIMASIQKKYEQSQASTIIYQSKIDKNQKMPQSKSRSKDRKDTSSKKIVNSISPSRKSINNLNLNSNSKIKLKSAEKVVINRQSVKTSTNNIFNPYQRPRSPVLSFLDKKVSNERTKPSELQSTSIKSKDKSSFLKSKISRASISDSISKSSSRQSSSESSSNNRMMSPQKMIQKLKERSEIAHNSFKINLQDLIKVDEIFEAILTRQSFDTSFVNFEILREYLINQYCFILKDLNLLFCNEKFREVMRENYAKEVLYFTYIYILIVKNRFEFAGLQKSLMASSNRIDNEYVKSYIVSINKETEDLMLQVLSYIHIVFIFRAEIFLDRATVYYQNHKLFRKLQLLLSKRKSKFNITSSRKDNYEEHIVKINRYLDLCEQALHELFKLNPSFSQISQFLADSLLFISQRRGELKTSDFNVILKDCKTSFDSKGITMFTPKDLLHESPIVFESDFSETKPVAPFIKDSIINAKKLTLVIDLDETLIHYPEEHLKDLDSKVNVDHVKVRPHAYEFLEQMSAYFEMIIFTAASQSYADPIIDFIDPKGLVKHRLYRQHLTMHNGKLIKDLSKIGRDIKRLIMLDNLPENFILQPENGVYVKSWLGDLNDRCLLLLLSVFVYVVNNAVDDIRNVLMEFKSILVESIK